MTTSEDRGGAQRAPANKELRLALAMRGGVSLAVWIGGAISEIDLARRADDDGPAAGDFWPQMLTMSDYDRVIVDVLAGASAGGLNGVLYAASQVYDFRYHAMREVWLTVGGTEGMVRTHGPWPSLFKGDDYFLETVHEKLAALATTGSAGPGARERVDLALSATVMEPVMRPLPSPEDEPLFERRYAGGFRFRQPEEPWLPTDFPPPTDAGFKAGVWRLAIAARSTSSYPGAFEAAQVRSTRRATFDSPAAGTGTKADVDLDGTFLDRTVEADKPFVVADGGILDNIPIRCALDYVATAPASGPTERVLVYLQPGAPSQPKPPVVPTDEERRSTLSVIRGVVGARVAGETINEDIAAIEAYNEAIERAATMRPGTFDGLTGRASFLKAAKARRASYNITRASYEAGGIVALLLDPMGTIGEDQFPATVANEPVGDDRWRSPIAGWPQAVRENLDAELNRAMGAALGRAAVGEALSATGEVGPLLRVTDLLIEWTRWLEPVYAPASSIKGSLYAVRAFLSAILDRTRKLAWVASAARVDGNHAAFVEVAVPALRLLTMVEPDVATGTARALQAGEKAPLERVCRQALLRIDGVVAGAAAGLASDPPAPPAARPGDRADLLGHISELLVELVAPLAGAPDRTSEEGKEKPPAELLHRVLRREPLTVEALEALDVLCLPEFVSGLPGRRRVDFRRLSSANRTPLAQEFTTLMAAAKDTGMWWDPDPTLAPQDQQGIHVSLKLAGNELANFSAFLLAHWRANDWLWGRLDAVPTMVDLLVRPEHLARHLAEGQAKGRAPLAEVRALVAPEGHPWQKALEARVWNAYAEDIRGQVDRLLAAQTDDERRQVEITAIRSALIARRQWEILGEEFRLPKSQMGNPPSVTASGPPSFDEVSDWVAGYDVGAEVLSGNDHAPELLERFGEIGTAVTETALWNVSLPSSRLPRLPRFVANAIRRLGPRLARQLAQRAVLPKTKAEKSRTRVGIAFLAAVLLVLGVLGWFIDRWAFLFGFGVSFVPLGLLGGAAWWRLRKMLEKDDVARSPQRAPAGGPSP